MICAWILTAVLGWALSAGDDWEAAAVRLCGVSGPEALDERVWERFQSFAHHPLPLNLSSRSRLLASGLFSSYQVAVLLDYRARSGDILSEMELSLLDGFDAPTAHALSHFVSFASASLPGAASSDTLRGRVRQRLELRTKGPSAKYRLSFGERAEAGIAFREGQSPVFYGVCYGRGRIGKVVAGNFNVRFGQGLALWSGFVIDDMLSVSALVRRAGGLSPSWSYSGDGTWRGAGLDLEMGRWDMTLFAAQEGLGGNAGWTWRGGRTGVSVVWPAYGNAPRLSGDIRCALRGVQLFSEVAVRPLQGAFAGVGGCIAPMGEHVKGGVRLTVLPSAYSGKKNGEYGAQATVSFQAGRYVPLKGRTGFGSSEQRHRGAVALSFSSLPVPGGDTGRMMEKCKALWQYRISPALGLEVRASQRWRNYSNERNRIEVRTDLDWSDGRWTAACRLHGAWCEGSGGLAFAELGRKGRLVSFSLRGAVFHTAGWASRIYVYERDAPGNFNVPAYYGRGWALNGVFGARADFRYGSVQAWARLYLVGKNGGLVPGLSLQLAISI